MNRFMPSRRDQRETGGENQVGSGSSHRMNIMSATALSQIPPKTNVQVLDDYYSNYNTQGQIGSIKFTAEFERLSEKIEKFWKLKDTSKVEREKVRKILS